jgi:hypothetical protein
MEFIIRQLNKGHADKGYAAALVHAMPLHAHIDIDSPFVAYQGASEGARHYRRTEFWIIKTMLRFAGKLI